MSCVTREVTLPVDVDEAWETVTELREWLVEDADLELHPGAEGTLVLPDGEQRQAVVEDVEPGERLTFWWWAGEERATHVALTLEPDDDGTRVVVVESGFSVGPVAIGGVPGARTLPAGAIHRTSVGTLPVGLITPLLRAGALADRLVDAAERRAAPA